MITFLETVMNGLVVTLAMVILVVLSPIIIPLWIIGKIALKCGVDIHK